MNQEILNNRYQIQSQLGQTNKRALLALDLQKQQQVVIKLLYLGKDFDWQELKLFEREAETLKNLNHPAIPQYIDYFEFDTSNDKGFGLVQSYVAAKSLEEHVSSGRRFNTQEIKELASAILEILEYVHSQQPPIIHRDIKPSNILLTNRSGNSVGQVYLVDFGSVQNIAAQEGGTITVVGTYGYMPPEQFGGRTKPASDIYSLGATLIYLVTGMHPTELPQQNLQIQFREFADIIPKLADWLEWMTEPSLEKRFTSARVTKEAIDNPLPRTNALQTQQLLEKPSSTKVGLTKTEDKLKIVLPPKGFGIVLISLISLATPFALGFNLFQNDTYNVYPTSAVVIILAIKYLAIGFLLLLMLWGLFKTTSISIKSKSIILTHKLFWFKWQRVYKVDTSKISHVKFASSQTNTKINPQLLLIASGVTLFNFDKYSNLTNAERRWLAQEIEIWLNK